MTKKIFYSAVLFLSTVILLTSCAKELEFEPKNSDLTREQISAISKTGAGKKDVWAGGTYAALGALMADYESHQDFGIGNLFLIADAMGDVGFVFNNGYDHYLAVRQYSERGVGLKSVANAFTWKALYRYIQSTNLVIDDPNSSASQKAQAYGMRAYFYHMLVRFFAPYPVKQDGTFDGSVLGVVLRLEAGDNDLAKARATAKETYDQIISDLENSEKLFESLPVDEKNPNKGGTTNLFSYAAALAVHARVALDMQDFATAKTKAREAINESGATPYSLTELQDKMLFYNATDHNMIWTVTYTANSPSATWSQGLASWTGFTCAVAYGTYGYVPYLAGFKMNNKYTSQIPESDVRHEWFLYPKTVPNPDDPTKNITIPYSKLLANYGNGTTILTFVGPDPAPRGGVGPLVVSSTIKMGPPSGNIYGNIADNCTPLLRVEELYYIEAEAAARGGDVDGGIDLLSKFVNTYRNDQFEATVKPGLKAGDLQVFMDEIFFQRQIEFVQEGFNIFDIKRLHRGVVRSKAPADKDFSFWPAKTKFNIPPDSKLLTLPIYGNEIDQNPLCVQNPIGGQPADGSTF